MKNLISLCENRDYKRLYNRGKSVVNSKFVLYVLKNRSNNVRLGITTSKKIGNAVKRNRSRRILRQAVINLLPQIKDGNDLVLVARGRTPFLKSTDIEFELKKSLKKIQLLKE